MNAPETPLWRKVLRSPLLGGGLLVAIAGAMFQVARVSDEPTKTEAISEAKPRAPRLEARPSIYKPYRIDHGDGRSLNEHAEEIKGDLRAAASDNRQTILVLERSGDGMDSVEAIMKGYRNPAYRAAWQAALSRDEASSRYALLHGGVTQDGKSVTQAGSLHESLAALLKSAQAGGYRLELEFEIPPIESIPEGFRFEEAWGRSLEAFLSGRAEEALRWMKESVEHDLKQIRLRDDAYRSRIEALLATPGRFVFDLRGGFHDPIVTGERRSVIEAEVRRQVEKSIPILRYHHRLALGDLNELEARELLKLSLLQTLLEDVFIAEHHVSEPRAAELTTQLAERLRFTDEEFRSLSLAMGKAHSATATVKPVPFEDWILSHPRLGPVYRQGRKAKD